MMRAVTKIGLLMGLAVGWCSSASAQQTESETISIPGRSIIVNATSSTTVNPSILSEFHKFDPAKGTLTQVNFTFNYDFQGTLVTGPNGEGGGASASGQIVINGVPNLAGGGNGTGNGGPPNTTIPLTFPVTGSFTFPPPDDILATMVATTPGETGTFDYQPAVSASPSPGATVSVDLAGTSSLTVTYTFTPAPEPGSLALSMVAAVGLCGCAWRRRR